LILNSKTPAFLVTGAGIPSAGSLPNWEAIRDHFHLPDTDTIANSSATDQTFPETIHFRGREVRYRGFDFFEVDEFDVNTIAPGDLGAPAGAEVSGTFVINRFPTTLAVLIRDKANGGKKFLSNGNFVHLEMAWVYSRLMREVLGLGPVDHLERPFFGYVSFGDTTAALAVEDDSHLMLRLSRTVGRFEVVEFDEGGAQISDEIFDIGTDPILSRRLGARHLLVVRPKRQLISIGK
jgi:hypothetical protein